MQYVVEIVFLTDLHIGNPKVPAKIVHENLIQYLYPTLDDTVDFLILGGDFFDGMVTLDSEAGLVANMIIRDLQLLAAKHKFLIRGIRGTFTHDRHQAKQLMVASKQMPLRLGNKQLIIIHDNVIVEKFDKHGISMLFIPDELPFDNLFETAHELITAASLDKVDIVVHHGYCQHLLPSNLPHTPPNVYSAKEYAQLAHGPVLNGHVHKPGVYRQIVSGGSFERLAHAEEEDKGFFIVEYNPDNHHTSYNFIKNSGAIKFLTIDLPPTVTIPVALTMLQDVAELLVGEILAYVRIKTDDPILRHAAKEMMKKYQNIVFGYDSISRSKQQIDVVGNEDLKCVLQPMTPDNLPEIISKFLATSGITLTTEVIKTELAEL